MRKARIFALILSIMIFLTFLVSCSDNKDEQSENNNSNVFPVSTYDENLPVTLGDVMPFYDNGVMNLYHLQNTRGSLSTFYHPIARITTENYVNYQYEGIAIPFEENYNSPDAAIGTGSFIKDEQGLYHCFYTGHNAEQGTGLPYFEVVRHATSPDQKTWTKDENFNLYGTSNDFRDPYVYYDEYDECYYMLVTTNQDGRGVIKRYSSQSLSATAEQWLDCGIFFANDQGIYNMECPSYIEYNGYWYLAYSEQGDNRVTHYRYRTERNGEWKKFERDSIDASGFYAGQLELAEGRLFAFAWCATLTGGSVGEFDWGGNLVAHEIKQMSNGELCAVLIDEVSNALQNEAQYTATDGKQVTDIQFDGKQFEATAFSELKEGVTLMSFDVTLNDFNGNFGITFGLDDFVNNRLGVAIIAFEPSKNTLACYNDVSNVMRYGDVLAQVNFIYAVSRTYKVNILIDGEVLTVYLDNTVALTARIIDLEKHNFAIYSNGTSVTIGGLKFYE